MKVLRGPLFESESRPLFSGHETFPLRYGWLKKAVDAVAEVEDEDENKFVFLGDDSIARFGVGKNMVASIRHWAKACGIVTEDSSRHLTVTPLGKALFGENGVDPYLEHPGTLWLLHWNVCGGTGGDGLKATWFWVFNHFNRPLFSRKDLVEALLKLVSDQGWARISRTTVKRDVECFIRCYEARSPGRGSSAEDTLESVLAELGLIRGIHGQFQLVRGPKRTLPHVVFAYALNSFWRTKMGAEGTLSFEAILHEPGSPGRVFLLDEADLTNRLLGLEDTTSGALRWSETAGLRQVLRIREMSEEKSLAMLCKSLRQRQYKRSA